MWSAFICFPDGHNAKKCVDFKTSELIQQAVTKMRESSMNIGMFALGMEREVEDDWYEAIP